jgi:hypothetical protein
MQGDARKCTAVRRDGAPCSAPALPSSAFCFAHDPTQQAALRESRAAGGRAKRRTERAAKLVPASLRPTLEAILAAVEECREGTISPQQASGMAALAGAACKLYDVGVLQERLGELEARVGVRRSA